MKQFLLLAALVCSSAYAQQPALSAEENTLFLDSIITYKSDNSYRDKRVNTYNANNDITSKANYLWQYGQWQINSETKYAYDENYRITSEAAYEWAAGQWVKKTETVYSYDENGIQTQMYYRWMDGIWYAPSMYDLTFDDRGNVIKSIVYSKLDDQWIYQNMYEYAYDDNGNQTLKTVYYWQDGQWVGAYKDEYAYDDKGNKTLDASYRWQDGQWVGSSKEEYAYDDKRAKIFDAQYSDWQDGYWTSLEEKTWDKDKNMTSKANYAWQDGQWAGISKTEYSSYEYYYYPIKYLCWVDYIWQDGDWCISSGTKFEYTFDDKGIETSRIGYTWKDGQWQQNNTEFTYDDLGRLICIEDYSNGGGRIKYKTEYTYNENGNIANRIFYEYQSRGNSVKYGMKYEYAYEEEGSMKETRYIYSSTRWDFVYECKLVANGNMISEIEIENINSQMPQKYESTYDENGNILTKTSYKWDDYRKDWAGISRYVYAYDDYGHQTTYISYGWDTWNPEGGWIGSTHWECVYLDEHNYLQETIYFWNYNTHEWDVNYYLNYYYSDHTTGIDNITEASRSTAVRKVLVDGQLRIVKGDRTYNATGNRIR